MDNPIDLEIMAEINKLYEDSLKDELLWTENLFVHCLHLPYEHRQRGYGKWVYRTPTRLATAWIALLMR